MLQQKRLLMRMAIDIHAQLQPKVVRNASVELPMAAWGQCETLHRKLNRASYRGWRLATQRIQNELRWSIERLRAELNMLDHQLEPPRESQLQPSPADIYADLVGLHAEFEEVSIDRRQNTLSVTTEAIELEGIYLGPFEIRLNWSDQRHGHPPNYRVIAVDANPAAANEGITHPHVQDEAVCEGDGQQPIRKALEEGRLLDFFLIVANLLRTYNSSSPFISLSDWHGVECADCGRSVCEDERWTCEKCETTICGECCYNCPDCESSFCSECATRCESCDENHCSECMKECSHCKADLCISCLDDNERCSDCHDQELEEESETPGDTHQSDRSDGPGAPLQPNRLGQTAVPA